MQANAGADLLCYYRTLGSQGGQSKQRAKRGGADGVCEVLLGISVVGA
jgi:hypothetical protein